MVHKITTLCNIDTKGKGKLKRITDDVSQNSDCLLSDSDYFRVNITGGSGGLGKAILQHIEETYTQVNILLIGGRDQSKLEQAAGQNKYLTGDIFTVGTEAHTYLTEILPLEGGTTYMLAATNPDRLSEGDKNPSTGEEWGDISEKDKIQVRKDVIQKELDTIEAFFINAVQNRTASSEKATIKFAGSISALIDNPLLYNGSQYGEGKNKLAQLIEKYRYKLEDVNMYIVHYFLGLLDKGMVRPKQRENTGKLLKFFSVGSPVEGKALLGKDEIETFLDSKNNNWMLPTEKVAQIMTEDDTQGGRHLLYSGIHFDRNEQNNGYLSRKNKIQALIECSDLPFIKEKINLEDKKTKTFLLGIRKTAMDEHLKNNSQILSAAKLKKRTDFHILQGKKIIQGLLGNINKEQFTNLVMRLYDNHK